MHWTQISKIKLLRRISKKVRRDKSFTEETKVNLTGSASSIIDYTSHLPIYPFPFFPFLSRRSTSLFSPSFSHLSSFLHSSWSKRNPGIFISVLDVLVHRKDNASTPFHHTYPIKQLPRAFFIGETRPRSRRMPI